MRRVRTPPRIAPRPKDAHKASVGRVLVVGGSRDLVGAPTLAALGALRAGAGLVRIAVPASLQRAVATIRPEATTAGLPETEEASLAPAALDELRAILDAWDAVVLGPGGGRAPTTVVALGALACRIARPLVLDADGLFSLGADPSRLRERREATIVTPHEGEAARLLDTTSSHVRADRERAALSLAATTGAVVVLKGPGTIVTDGERLFTSRRGGPWLATGGTGDVLSGVVAAFLAGLPGTGGDAFGAACAAVDAHGRAGDAAAHGHDRGLIATDVAEALPDAVATLVGPARGTRKR